MRNVSLVRFVLIGAALALVPTVALRAQNGAKAPAPAPVAARPAAPQPKLVTTAAATRRQNSGGGGDAASNTSAFDAVWQVLESRFYDETLRGLGSRQATRDAYRRRAAALGGDDDAGFAALVNEMLGKLNASHTRLFTPNDFEFYLLPVLMGSGGAARRGLSAGRANNGPGRGGLRHIGALARATAPNVVAAVLNGSPAEKVGLRAGDVLVSVNGAPYHGLTAFDVPGPVTLDYRRGNSDVRTARVTPVAQNPLDALYDATRQSVTTWTLPVSGNAPARRIGYIHLWTMAQPRFAEFLESAVRGPVHDTDALVLDLRDGFGGSPTGYADVFFRPDVREWYRGHDGKNGRTGWTAYAKPLVVLINGGTRSAKEMFAWTLQQSGRATLVGERTAGAVLAATGTPIGGNRFYLSYAATDITLNGERLEGRGVSPDVPVPPTTDEAAWQRAALAAVAAKLGVPGARIVARPFPAARPGRVN